MGEMSPKNNDHSQFRRISRPAQKSIPFKMEDNR